VNKLYRFVWTVSGRIALKSLPLVVKIKETGGDMGSDDRGEHRHLCSRC
jgi:hypothetical protein